MPNKTKIRVFSSFLWAAMSIAFYIDNGTQGWLYIFAFMVFVYGFVWFFWLGLSKGE